MPHTLIIHHVDRQDKDFRFSVVRLSDGQITGPVSLQSPEDTPVAGRPDSNLMLDLRWYLEQFLDYPFEPNTDVAQRVQDALRGWGEDCFSRLFSGRSRDWYQDVRRSGDNLSELTLKIASDDPHVLAWPWEALRDPEGTTLAHTCSIERQLHKLHDPLPLPENLPRDRINLLLVIARPYGKLDVGYHALSRPLIEQIHDRGLPVKVDVVRPPTFARLRDILDERPGYYHIVHFDGHGGYGRDSSSSSPYTFRGPQGRLIFENSECGPDEVQAGKLTQLLSDHRIPIMVLNACQSARIDDQAEDPFASVAAALLKAGIRSVVAMGYNLYVSGARHFSPAFYQQLINTGDVGRAMRAGRRAMLTEDRRVCVLGEFPLQDWLVPVLYQQSPAVLPRIEKGQTVSSGAERPLPQEALEQGDYGFIGRERAVQELERAMLRQPQAGILIHGMAGIGKTSLARGFLRWLRDTNGLGEGVFWFSFDDIHNAEFVINRLVDSLSGSRAAALPLEQKLELLISKLREHPFLIVWNNFESAAGIQGTEVAPLLSEGDRDLLKMLLKRLRGGKSTILITSRSPERWLTPIECFRLPLGGLVGEEQWEYSNAVVRDLGLEIKRDDQGYLELMQELAGHPLAIRAVLLRLGEQSAAALLAELKKHFAGATDDESSRAIFAALHLLDQGLPAEYASILQFIGLHHRYVDGDYLEAMGKSVPMDISKSEITGCCRVLENGGLLHGQGQSIYGMHPALGGFLRARRPASEEMQRAFVDFMGSLAGELVPKALHEQRGPFALHGANFHYALSLAEHLDMKEYAAALSWSLAAFAQNNRDFATAEQWYRKSLAIFEKQGDEHGAAITCHQLGIIAQEQRDFATAEQWYRKSLAIDERQGDEYGAANTYHELGMIAQEQRDFATAEQWYRKSLAVEERQGDEHGAAITYGQLGMIAQEQRDFATAKQWYRKSLAIFEKQDDEHGAASTYNQLGSLAWAQGDFAAAGAWLIKAALGFSSTNDLNYLGMACGNFARVLQAADEPEQMKLKKAWKEAGMERLISVEELLGNPND